MPGKRQRTLLSILRLNQPFHLGDPAFAPRSRRGRVRVLAGDTKPENLHLLQALLREHGHTVDSASNGQSALELARRGNYDVIVSDILMPHMDGFQLCRELKREERLRHVPFVFCTATYTDPADAELGFSVGANRFLMKPIEPEILLKHIEDAASEGSRPAVPPPPGPRVEEEVIQLKEYNESLIRKLEKKMLDLERANQALEVEIAAGKRAEAEGARLELQLRQTQKMEAISTLAGGIAHDFNNILVGIFGFAELAKQDAGNAAATQEHLSEILKAAQRAKDLVRQILAFSRPPEQKHDPMRLAPVVKESLSRLRAAIPAAIEISTHLDSQSPAVLANSAQVQQVVTNLVTNAWHAIGDKAGRIEVRLVTVDVDADFARGHPGLRPQRYVRLCVKDDGQGMDAATIERIFEPFFTTKEPGQGTGLGLAVVHGIMRALDGAITVDSLPDQGAAFCVYFPVLELDPAPATTGVSEVPHGSGQRVLFVDDERALCQIGERFLSQFGYVPFVSTDPVAALELFRERPFELVITDLRMQDLSGVDFGRQILQLRPETPIILMTGYSGTLDAEGVRGLGFRELLLKPYTARAFAECVHRVLSERPKD
jgi:signal transduction histidine kinase